MVDINKIFYSDKTNKPHNECVFCEENILEYEQGYVIEKAFKYNESLKGFDLVFEYALCSECVQRLSSEMSEKSRKKIEQYFTKNKESNKNGFFNEEQKLNFCMVTGENLKKSEEFQIGGFFIKNKMILSPDFPYGISSEVIEDIQNLISEKTRRFSDTFKDIILPPEIKKSFPKDRIVIF